MKILIIFATLIFTSLSHAIPEKDFSENWRTTVLPFFENLEQGEFKNAQGMSLKYYAYTRPTHKKTLVILTGRMEATKKYAEVVYDLKDKGLDIFIMDHQGQGESDRLLTDTNKGHIVRFSDYVRDFEQFMNEVVKPSHKETFLLSHSMGGAVSVHYLARHPEVFKKVVLVAPMLEINTKPYTEKVAQYYAKLLVTIGKGQDYAPDNGPYLTIPFETNPFTHSEARYGVEKYLYTTWPEIALGGPTARWVNESIKATKNSDKLPVKTPVLLFQAGKDLIVKPSRQNKFCKPSFCRMIKFHEAHHEILMEKDVVRDEAMKQINLFFGL